MIMQWGPENGQSKVTWAAEGERQREGDRDKHPKAKKERIPIVEDCLNRGHHNAVTMP